MSKIEIKSSDFLFNMGNRIQKARLVKNITQEQLAEKIDTSTQYISDLERGIVGCSIYTLIKLSNVLNISTDFILKRKPC